MNITDLINFFQQPEIINFGSSYIATVILDSTISSIKNVLKNDSIEFQVIDALEEALLKTCKKFNLEYDSSAIVETFLYSWNKIKLINNEEELKSILTNALGCEIESELFEYWALQFQIACADPKRIWLNNFINTCGLYNLNKRESIEDTVEKIMVDLSVIRRIRKNLPRNAGMIWGNNIYEADGYKNPYAMMYDIKKEGEKINIYPEMDYLLQLNSGGTIEPIYYQYVPFRWEFPILDFKFTNNGENTVVITGMQFNVKESHMDPSPVIILDGDIWGRNARHIKIVNDGWGEIRNLRLYFNIQKEDENNIVWKNSRKYYQHCINVGGFSECTNVDLTSIFRKYKVKTKMLDLMSINVQKIGKHGLIFLANQYKALGPFKKGYAKVYGVMEFYADTLLEKNRHFVVKFDTNVWMFNRYEILAMLPPSQKYEVMFEVEGKNYTRELNVSHSLVSQEADRLMVKIATLKSSIHKFDIKLVFNTGDSKTIADVCLHSIVSRLGLMYL